MKQFCFSSNLSAMMELFLTTRNQDGYLPNHYGYYLQELDALSKSMQNESFVTKKLIEAWDSAKPYLANRTKIQRHNSIRSFAAFAYAHDGLSYVPDASKLKSNSAFVPHIFTADEISRILLPPIVCHTGKMHLQGIWLFLLSLGCFMPVDYVLMRH